MKGVCRRAGLLEVGQLGGVGALELLDLGGVLALGEEQSLGGLVADGALAGELREALFGNQLTRRVGCLMELVRVDLAQRIELVLGVGLRGGQALGQLRIETGGTRVGRLARLRQRDLVRRDKRLHEGRPAAGRRGR